MELREFVAKTLSAILDGVEDAIRDAPDDRRGKIAPIIAGEEDWSKALHSVEFDVAVTGAARGTTDGKGSINVLPEGSEALERSKASRIKFGVPIAYGGERISRA
jgi:hypothetical protein